MFSVIFRPCGERLQMLDEEPAYRSGERKWSEGLQLKTLLIAYWGDSIRLRRSNPGQPHSNRP